jgi:hypothetical protein
MPFAPADIRREANRFIAALHRRIDEARRASAQPALVTSSSSR